MKISFLPNAWDDYQDWIKHDKRILKKINQLLEDIQRDPYDGIGKPEPLKHELSGAWSRRITDEHRLVYTLDKYEINIVSCKLHYDT